MTAPLERERLAKLPNLLGSCHDGEAVTTAHHADALVRRAGLTWHDVVATNYAEPRLDPVDFGIPNEIRFCLLNRHRLSAWERDSLVPIRHKSAPLSARQHNRLHSIVDKLRARAEAA